MDGHATVFVNCSIFDTGEMGLGEQIFNIRVSGPCIDKKFGKNIIVSSGRIIIADLHSITFKHLLNGEILTDFSENQDLAFKISNDLYLFKVLNGKYDVTKSYDEILIGFIDEDKIEYIDFLTIEQCKKSYSSLWSVFKKYLNLGDRETAKMVSISSSWKSCCGFKQCTCYQML